MRKVALVGAGRGGSALLPILSEYKDVILIGIADKDKNAPGLIYAKEHNIPVFYDYLDILNTDTPDVILNLTGDPSVSVQIIEKNNKIEVLGALSAKLLWDLVYERKKKEDEKTKILHDLANANRELKETTSYLENILKHSTDMIITTDTNGNIVMFNEGAEKILGYKKEEVIGTPINQFYLNSEEREKIVSILKEGGILSNYETRLRKKDRTTLDIILALSFLKDESGSIIGTVGISKDITDKKRLESEILKSNKELESFVYTVSHDLQAPLRAIDGFSNILLDEFKDKIEKEGIHYIERIKFCAQRMKMLIEDLLTLSKISGVDNVYENVDIARMLEEIKENIHYDVKEKNAVITYTEMPTIFCDKARMQQVFINLISNAIKYAKKGIVPKVIIGYSQNEGHHLFSIKDNGIGISERHFLKIFELFQRLHNMEDYEGTGVGLAIVKRVIDMHGGKIWVESREGEGSTFYFTIPMKKKQKEEPNNDIRNDINC